MTELSPVAAAYLSEYGQLPTDRREQDLYGAFRFGYEAGRRAGEHAVLDEWSRKMAEAAR